jgi:hypothetical protein
LFGAKRNIGRAVAVVKALHAAIVRFVAITDFRAGRSPLTVTVDFAHAKGSPVAAEA